MDGGDVPRMPLQLGCSGFVIVDAAGRLATVKTASFLDDERRCFRDVEGRLAGLLGDGGENDGGFAPGDRVVLAGLSNAAFNGRSGVVAATPADVRRAGRVAVAVDGEVLSLRLPNVKAAPAAAIDTAAMASVGHDELDAEHAAVGDLLDALLATPSAGGLMAAANEFAAHAAHEETLMARARFGGDPEDGMSAFASHRKDHGRIGALAADALKRGVDKENAAAFASAVLRHTENFDAKYAGALAKSAACGPCGSAAK